MLTSKQGAGVALAGLGLALVVGGWTFAQKREKVSPESLLPANAVVYGSLDAGVLQSEAARQTAAYQALVDSGLIPHLQVLVQSLCEQQEDALQVWNLVKTILQEGFSSAVAVDPPEQGPPSAWGVLVLHHADSQLDGLTQILFQALEVEEQEVRGRKVLRGDLPDLPMEIGWWSEGGHLVVAVGMNAVESALAVADGERENITKSPLWEKYRGKEAFDFAVNSIGWFDFKPLRDMFGEMPLPVPPGERDSPPTVQDVLEALGLDTLNHVATVSGYSGESLWSETIVDAPGERTGIMSLLDQKPLTMEDLPAIPTAHSGIMANSIDWGAAYDVLLEVARNLAAFGPPDASDQIEQALADAEEHLGFEPSKLFHALGHINCFYTDSSQGMFGTGGVLMISVEDSKTLEECLETGLTRMCEEFHGHVTLRKSEKHDHPLLLVEFPEVPFVAPTISIGEDWMILGLMPQSVVAQLLRNDEKLPCWDPEEALSTALDELPDEFTSLAIVDPRPTYQFAISAASGIAGVAALGLRESGAVPPEFQIPLAAEDLPPTELVLDPLFVNVAMGTVDEEGGHLYSRESLPGMPLLGGNSGATTMTTSAVLVALLLPAVQQAREAARRSQSKNNLKQIALSLHNYHDAEGHLPTGTIPNDDLEPEERLSWMVSILPYLEERTLWTEINLKEGWEADANSDPLQRSITFFLNPSQSDMGDGTYAVTHYVGIAGLGEDAPKLPVTDERAGMFGHDRVTRFRDVTDGLSNTLMVADASQEFGPWGAGGRPTIRALTEEPYVNGPDGIGSPHSGGFQAVLGDGAVRFISENIDPSVMEALSTIRGGEALGGF